MSVANELIKTKSDPMNIKDQLTATWIGVLTLITFGLSFWPFAGFLPPLSPELTQAEVVQYFQQHTAGIRFGMILMNVAGGLFCVLVASIAVQIRRIEKTNPIWTYTLIGTGGSASAILIIGGMLMTAAVFRPERSPDTLYMMYDLAWLFIVMPITPFAVMAFTIGYAILRDRSEVPVFPRWVGFFNIWMGLVFLPELLVTFFKTGPFAWNGLLAFWLPAGVFGLWFWVMFFKVRVAIRQQA